MAIKRSLPQKKTNNTPQKISTFVAPPSTPTNTAQVQTSGIRASQKGLPNRYIQPKSGRNSYSVRYELVTLPEYVVLKHNLHTEHIGITITDNNNNSQYLTSFSVNDENSITIYGINWIDTNVFTVNVFANYNTEIIRQDEII